MEEECKRSLASIQVVKDTEAIPGKDRIRFISFRSTGWRVIGGSDLKPGDKVVYIQYDSLLPVNPTFEDEMLRKRCFNERLNGFRISAMKMAGKVSEGIIYPMSILSKPSASYNEGDDVTEELGIIKVEDATPDVIPIIRKQNKLVEWVWKHLPMIARVFLKRKTGSSGAGFPEFMSKTDETRVQTLTYVFGEQWKGLPVYVTVKVDGQSATFVIRKGNFYVASRKTTLYCKPIKIAMRELNPKKINSRHVDSLFLATACKYDIPRMMYAYRKELGIDFGIQGEQAGPGIQGNKLGLPDVQLFLFNLVNVETNKYLTWEDLKAFATFSDISTVPFLEYTNFNWKSVDEMEAYSKGTYPNGAQREGVVIRSRDVMDAQSGMHGQWSLKVINPDFIV